MWVAAGYFLRQAMPYLIGAALIVAAYAVHRGVVNHEVSEAEEVLNERHAAKVLEIVSEYDRQLADAERVAREREQEMTLAAAKQSADFYERDERANKRIADADAAVRAGELRLRERFSCPSAGRAAAVSGAASDPARADAGTTGGFGDEDARAVVRIADEGDARTRLLNRCIGLLKIDRGMK